MSQIAPLNFISCTQCGGELHPDEGQIFVTCPYCSSTIYLDKSRVVFHWYLAPTLDDTQARAALARWMAGNQTVKDLDKKSQLSGSTFEFFPLWYFKLRQPNGSEQIVLEPAAATSVTQVTDLPLLAGDLRKYIQDIDAQARTPSVPLETATQWLRAQHSSGEISEQALVHIPLYSYRYQFQGQSYAAVVEAATGRVLANIYPAKAEAPYQIAGLLAALVFMGLALLPILGYLISEEEGLAIGMFACAGLGVLAAPVLFAVAAWVAAKV